jgi:predicted acylesterase/phospholipase RssA
MAIASDSPPAGLRKKVNLALQGGGAHGAFAWAYSIIFWKRTV